MPFGGIHVDENRIPASKMSTAVSDALAQEATRTQARDTRLNKQTQGAADGWNVDADQESTLSESMADEYMYVIVWYC
jgi:hypothetical protein